MTHTRREFVKWLSASAALAAVGGCASTGSGKAGRVVVIGGGYGGATAAKYLKLWGPDLDVTLVERNESFVSCPISNLVLGGSRTIADVTVGYGGLAKYGVRVVRGEATAIDSERRTVTLAGGTSLPYDRLVVSPGIGFIVDAIPSLKTAGAFDVVPHSWQAGPQTVLLRRQLEAMKDGGVFAISIPRSPYRCPPGPYERVCQVANYFKKSKPRSKVLVLDANENIQSKAALFTAAWNGTYKGMIEYRPNSELVDVDLKTRTAKLQFEEVRADVLNVVPPQRAGDIARQAGLITANERWCGINWLTMESVARPNIHVLGDATLAAPAMPKSGHMANQHAKIAAAAIVELMNGRPPFQAPVIANTCYSFIDDLNVVHVASVHSYDPGEKTLVVVKGSGGLSSAPTELEGQYAHGWARNIWADMLG